jgi:hypothetical protein
MIELKYKPRFDFSLKVSAKYGAITAKSQRSKADL